MVSKPEINANGVVLTPAIARQLAAQIILNSSGYEKPEGVAKMNPLQTYAWEMCGKPIQFIGIKDTAITRARKTFMGFPLVESDDFPKDQIIIVDQKGQFLGSIVNLAIPELTV
jgi:hypothetical protein